MPRPLHCVNCDDSFPHAHGADIHCSKECREEYAKDVEITVELLISAGFERDKNAPNIFRRKGVAATVEDILARGLQTVLADVERVSS